MNERSNFKRFDQAVRDEPVRWSAVIGAYTIIILARYFQNVFPEPMPMCSWVEIGFQVSSNWFPPRAGRVADPELLRNY